MLRITLRQLRTFEAVARLSSFTAAAKEMHVSQPTVSKQIKVLHEEIGLPLIEQVGKKVFLTEAGEELYATCAEWLNTWGQFEQTIADYKGMKQGTLKISAVTTTKYFMPRILGPFCKQYPGIDIRLEVLNRDRILERLANNEDDLYIMGIPPEDIDVESEAFLPNPLVVLAPLSHPWARQKNIAFEELAHQQFLMRERGSGTRLTIERIFKERGVPLNVRMELGSNEAIKQAVIGGLGLAVLSGSTLSLAEDQSEMCFLDVEGFPIKRNWHIVKVSGKKLSVTAKTFLDFMREHTKLLLPSGE